MPDETLELCELNPAWVFDCNSCGGETFVRCVTQYLGVDDAEDRSAVLAMFGPEALERMDADPNYRVSCQTHPRAVTCRHCGERFRAVGPDCQVDDGEGGGE